MYHVDYADPEFAREEYAKLEAPAAAPCLTCDGTPCASACPNGIPVAELTREAARTLA